MPADSPLIITSLRSGDEDQRHAMRRLAFGARTAFDVTAPTTDPDRVVAAYDDARLAATVLTLAFTQSWGGSDVPLGAVAGVIVRPEYRNRGVARQLLAESFDRMAARGEVLSALFPTTATLYRSVGYEIAGWHRRCRYAIGDLPRPSGDVTWRQTDLEDPVAVDLYRSMAARHDGWVTPSAVFWAFRHHEFRADPTVNRFCFVGSRDGVAVSVVRYRYTESAAFLYDIEVELLAGADGDAIGDALAFIGSNGMTAGTATFEVPIAALAPQFAHLQRGTAVEDWPWMIRLVDAAGAIAARGVPSTVTGSVALDISDEVRPANAGRFVLDIDGGESRLEPGGAGTVACTIQTLAALYGGADPGILAWAGALPGATERDLDVFRAGWRTEATNPIFF